MKWAVYTSLFISISQNVILNKCYVFKVTQGITVYCMYRTIPYRLFYAYNLIIHLKIKCLQVGRVEEQVILTSIQECNVRLWKP